MCTALRGDQPVCPQCGATRTAEEGSEEAKVAKATRLNGASHEIIRTNEPGQAQPDRDPNTPMDVHTEVGHGPAEELEPTDRDDRDQDDRDPSDRDDRDQDEFSSAGSDPVPDGSRETVMEWVNREGPERAPARAAVARAHEERRPSPRTTLLAELAKLAGQDQSGAQGTTTGTVRA